MKHPDSPPYVLACMYPNEMAARNVYAPVQTLLHETACNLSAYRFLAPGENTWYVVVLGEHPDQALHTLLETLLRTRGTPVTLTQELLNRLMARRQQTTGASWVEGHYFR